MAAVNTYILKNNFEASKMLNKFTGRDLAHRIKNMRDNDDDCSVKITEDESKIITINTAQPRGGSYLN